MILSQKLEEKLLKRNEDVEKMAKLSFNELKNFTPHHCKQWMSKFFVEAFQEFPESVFTTATSSAETRTTTLVPCISSVAPFQETDEIQRRVSFKGTLVESLISNDVGMFSTVSNEMTTDITKETLTDGAYD